MGVGSLILLALSFMIVGVFTETRAEDEATLELPPPATVEETIGPLDMTWYEWAKRRPITNWLKDKLKDMAPFIRDTDLNVQLRTYYFFDEGLDRTYSETTVPLALFMKTVSGTRIAVSQANSQKTSLKASMFAWRSTSR